MTESQVNFSSTPDAVLDRMIAAATKRLDDATRFRLRVEEQLRNARNHEESCSDNLRDLRAERAVRRRHRNLEMGKS